MNYKKHYDKLIENAQNRSILKSEYKESHHIIPKCIGGSDEKSNLVNLFPEEHLVAHLLLVKIYPNNSGLLKAAFSMTNGFNYGTRNLNKEYKWLKQQYSKNQSEWLKENHYLKKMSESEREIFLNDNVRGKNNPNYGNKWSVEQRKKASERGKLSVGENNPNYGNRGPKNPLYGVPKSEEHKRKMSENVKGEKNPCYGLKGKLAKEAKTYIITNPEGVEIILFGTIATTIKEFCIKNNLNLTRIKNNINKGIIGKTYVAFKNKIDVVNCEGWMIDKIG